jgi:hypothetical protein
VHFPPWMSDRLVDLLRGMLQVSVLQRLAVNEIKRHGWVTAEEEDNLMLGDSDSDSDGELDGGAFGRRGGRRSDDGGRRRSKHGGGIDEERGMGRIASRRPPHPLDDDDDDDEFSADEGGDWGVPVGSRNKSARGGRRGRPHSGGSDDTTDVHAQGGVSAPGHRDHPVSSTTHDHMAAHYHNLALLDDKPKYGPGNAVGALYKFNSVYPSLESAW